MINFQSLNRNLGKIRPSGGVSGGGGFKRASRNLCSTEPPVQPYLSINSVRYHQNEIERDTHLLSEEFANEGDRFKLSSPIKSIMRSPRRLNTQLNRFQNVAKLALTRERAPIYHNTFIDEIHNQQSLFGVSKSDKSGRMMRKAIPYDSSIWLIWDPIILVSYLYYVYIAAMSFTFYEDRHFQTTIYPVLITLIGFIDLLLNIFRSPDKSRSMTFLYNVSKRYMKCFFWLDLFMTIKPHIREPMMVYFDLIRLRQIFRSTSTINRSISFVVMII